MDVLLQDLRYAVRRLTRSPGFTLAAILCVAIGVGANAAIFSLVNGVLLRPLGGITASEGLLEIGRSQDGEGSDTFGYPTLQQLRQSSETVDVAAWSMLPLAIGGAGEPEALIGAQVSENYLQVLGASPRIGRGFLPEEVGPGAGSSVVVISDGLWQRRFEGADVIGTLVRVNGVPATIIGVAPAGFAGTLSLLEVDAWVPFGMTAAGLATDDSLVSWDNNFVLAVGRLRTGATLDGASAELGGIMSGLVEDHPEALLGQGVAVSPLRTLPAAALGIVQVFMAILMTVVGLVLLVACVNVAGMLLARSMTRRREVALRLALGASRGRLIRQLLTESGLLFGFGGLAGLGLAVWATRLLLAFDPPIPPPFDVRLDLSLDGRVLAFCGGVTLLSGLIFGLVPALRASRPDLVPALREADGAGTPSRSRLRSALIVAQVAMTTLLLVGAGLFLRALSDASTTNLGFDPDGVYALSLNLDMSGYTEPEGQQLLRDLAERLGHVPGVESASFSALLPLGIPTNMGFGGLKVSGVDPPAGQASHSASVNVVSPSYFATLGLDLTSGSGFGVEDDATAPNVVVINEHTASVFWPGEEAVGAQLELGETVYTVRGVVADSKYSSLNEELPFFIYLPVAQRYRPSLSLLVRSRPGFEGVISSVRDVSRQLAPDLPFLDVIALREYVEVAFLPQRIAATVAGGLGLVTILLAAIGMYGVTAQAAYQRVREIGLRKALGASGPAVLRLVIRQGMVAPAVGLAIGLLAAAALTRFLSFLLFGVSPLDPIAYGAGLLMLLAAAFAANYIPARWAAAVDPVTALRFE